MATETTEEISEELDPAGEFIEPKKDSADEAGEDQSEDSGSTGDTDSASDDESPAAALDELEAEELEMLTDDESDETLVIDEAAEMRAIRRAELAMQNDSIDEATSKEFVCTSCFLVKRESQLANKRKKICLDCAS